LVPAGFLYQTEFIHSKEEADLIAEIQRLPLHEAKYKQFTAKRRILSYGGSYDFSINKLEPAEPVPEFLFALRRRIADWARLPEETFAHVLIAEYSPGTQLGWHRDVPNFEVVAGVSLGGWCRMRLRPYPPTRVTNAASIAMDLEPRSAYILRDEARWCWQHSIRPTPAWRYSITFRTFTSRAARAV